MNSCRVRAAKAAAQPELCHRDGAAQGKGCRTPALRERNTVRSYLQIAKTLYRKKIIQTERAENLRNDKPSQVILEELRIFPALSRAVSSQAGHTGCEHPQNISSSRATGLEMPQRLLFKTQQILTELQLG